MNSLDAIKSKITERDHIASLVEKRRSQNEKIVFTNGCFDLLHPGHVHLLAAARSEGDCLIVGLNTDASVNRIKPDRPIQNEQTRALMLAALELVDAVVLFNEETPLELIRQIHPDVLVKGADYQKEEVIGKEIVESYGGRVVLVELLKGFSTTSIIEKIRNR